MKVRLNIAGTVEELFNGVIEFYDNAATAAASNAPGTVSTAGLITTTVVFVVFVFVLLLLLLLLLLMLLLFLLLLLLFLLCCPYCFHSHGYLTSDHFRCINLNII